MFVFLDTEFTDFVQIDLISIALVSEDGRFAMCTRVWFGENIHIELTDSHACKNFAFEFIKTLWPNLLFRTILIC